MLKARPESLPRTKVGRHPSEASESQILVASAFELARKLAIPRILVLADLITDRRTVEHARQNETVIWLTHGGERESYPEIRAGMHASHCHPRRWVAWTKSNWA